MTASLPRLALPMDAPLPLSRDSITPRFRYTDERLWRSWLDVESGKGRYIELPWFEEQQLMRGRVLVPQDGIGADIIGSPEPLCELYSWALPQLHTPSTNSNGQWLLGEVQMSQ